MSSLCLTKHNIVKTQVWGEIEQNAFLVSELEEDGCCGISPGSFTLREIRPRTQWLRCRVGTRSGLNGVQKCSNNKLPYFYIICIMALQAVWTDNPAVSCVGHYPNIGGNKGRLTWCSFRLPQRRSGKIWNGTFYHATILSTSCFLSCSDRREYWT